MRGRTAAPPVAARIWFSASIEVLARIPVAASIRSHRRVSASNPSQPDDVPFQAMTSTFASARSSAAARIGRSSNCARASSVSAICLTRKREKCTETVGKAASMALVTGSSAVFDEGVSMPRRIGAVIAAAWHEAIGA